MKTHTYKLPLVFLMPAGVVYGLFVVYPILRAFHISLFEWTGVTAASHMKFIGLRNFARVLTNPFFWSSLRNNLYILIVGGIGSIGLALLFAVLLHRGIRGSRFFRIAFFFPNVIATVAVAMLWMFIYSPLFGILNNFLSLIGLESLTHVWLAEAKLVIPSVTVPFVWQTIGFYLVIILAGLQNMPVEIFDAAKIDGANDWQQFRFITLPLLRPIITIVSIFWFIGAMRVFDLIWVMVKTGSVAMVEKTDVLASFMYIEAFRNYNMGYATAISVIMFILIGIGSALLYITTKGETVEY